MIQAIPIQTDPTLVRGNPLEAFELLGSGPNLSVNEIPRYDVTPDGARLLVSIPAGLVIATGAGDEVEDDYRRVNVILNFFEELKELLPVP